MRFNGKELVSVALQPSHKFDKEGILFIREKQEGIFRRGEAYIPRFCRLRGNLLFYFKSSDQCSEPAGVFILEQCSVSLENGNTNGVFSFILTFENDKSSQHFATSLESERDMWIQALHMASYEYMRSQLNSLQEKLKSLKNQEINSKKESVFSNPTNLIDSSDENILEMSFACDNLICDGNGTPPNPMLTISILTSPDTQWLQYAQTEILERCSNPCFLTTVGFKNSEKISGATRVKISAYDVCERLTCTMTLIGLSVFTISEMMNAEKNKLRLTLLSSDNAAVGFVTVSAWQIESEQMSSSAASSSNQASPQDEQESEHPRSQTLPVKLPCKSRTGQLSQMNLIYDKIISQTYRFHTGLGADLSVHEIMAECKLAFSFPQLLLILYIKEEKEVLNCITSLGELTPIWNKKQVEEIERHLQLINNYTQVLTFLDSYEGPHYKASALKGEPSLEFVPVNLHLQRMWVQNDSTKKNSFYDVITVGAFAAHSLKFKHGGLSRLLSGTKYSKFSDSGNAKKENTITDKLFHAAEAAWKIKNLRHDLRDALERLNKFARHHSTGEMQMLMVDIANMAYQVTKLCEPFLIEEACQFFEEIKISRNRTNDNGYVSNRSSPLRVSSGFNSPSQSGRSRSAEKEADTSSVHSFEEKRDVNKEWPFRHIHHRRSASDARLYTNVNAESKDADQHSLFNLETCEEESSKKIRKFNHTSSPSVSRKLTCKLQRHESAKDDHHSSRLSLGFVESNNSVFNLLRRTNSKPRHERSLVDFGCSDNFSSGTKTDDESVQKSQKSISLRSLNGSKFRSKSPDEPEPWDLTQLNIEASIMCMASKVQALCHRRQSLEMQVRGGGSSGSEKPSSATPPPVRSDWVEELRPSTKKLKQALDCLLKTSRLTHGLFILQEQSMLADQNCMIQFRRDIAFSQALTAAVSGLMTKFWCLRPDPTFLARIKEIGVLLEFEGLLSCYGDEIGMLEDMIVAIDDLKKVTFKLVRNEDNDKVSPYVEGSRSALTVILPVCDTVLTLLPLGCQEKLCFSVSPVFFNVGINEQATFAEKKTTCMQSVPSCSRFGDVTLQDRINSDGAENLKMFYEKYQSLPVEKEKYQRTSLPASYKSVDSLIDKLTKLVQMKKNKNVEILHTAAEICRLLGGVRFTSCKSAKDRTSMSVTLEQCLVLRDEFDLAEHEFSHALDCMRCKGTRRENTLKNAGVKKYAFNSLQLMALPKSYRPPPGTYGNVQT